MPEEWQRAYFDAVIGRIDRWLRNPFEKRLFRANWNIFFIGWPTAEWRRAFSVAGTMLKVFTLMNRFCFNVRHGPAFEARYKPRELREVQAHTIRYRRLMQIRWERPVVWRDERWANHHRRPGRGSMKKLGVSSALS